MADAGNFPKNIGRYEINKLLGSGAMGSVYLAEDPRIKRKLAIKVVKLDAIGSEKDRKEFLARFQREAEVSGLLNDPGIVTIYDVGDSEVGPFLAMEFIAGRPLDSYIKSGEGLTLKQKLSLCVGIAAALDHAHDKGIVHRDVKPGNIMITEDHRPKLMDFGIAKRDDASLTQTGTFLGTPSYASPEQIKEGVATAASDVFSFAVLTFELLSGSLPFPGTSINTILYKIVNEPPVEIKEPEGVLPEQWRAIFSRALAKNPAERHGTCSEFVKELLEGTKDLGRTDRMQLLGNLKPEHVSSTQRRAILDDPTPPPPAIQSVVGAPLLRGGKGALYGTVAALVLVASAGGFFLFRKGSASQILVDTLPTGAKATQAGRELGATPLPLVLKAGDVLHLEKKGYRPLDYRFKDGDAPPKLTLEALKTDETIRTFPEGATVVLDASKLPGTTPLTVKGWDQSVKHRLTCTKGDLFVATDFLEGDTPGTQVFTLVSAKETRVGAQPKAVDANAPGILRFSAPYPVHVKLDGRDLGEVREGGSLQAPPGVRRLELSNPRVFLRENQTVNVSPGQPVAVNLPGLANLTVSTFPNSANIIVDGIPTSVESDGNGSIQMVKGHHTVNVQGRSGAAQGVDLSGDYSLKMKF